MVKKKNSIDSACFLYLRKILHVTQSADKYSTLLLLVKRADQKLLMLKESRFSISCAAVKSRTRYLAGTKSVSWNEKAARALIENTLEVYASLNRILDVCLAFCIRVSVLACLRVNLRHFWGTVILWGIAV